MRVVFIARRAFVAVGLAVGTAVAGCGAPPGESVGETAQAVTFPNDQAAFDYFLGKGLTNFQAAGIVGNLDQESGVDPTAVQSGGPGRGIAQWSVGGRWDTDANDNATWYAGQQGQSVDSLQLQLDFIWYELTTFSAYGLASLEASTDVTGATTAFQNDFEGCGMCDAAQRIAYAQNVLNVFGNDAADGGPGIPSCTVPGVGAGVCIATSDCAAMLGHVSTPGYCPGPAGEQCCTGPSDAGTPSDGGPSDTGAPTDGGREQEGGDSGSGSPGFTPSNSKGCSTASGAAGETSAAYFLTGLAWIATRRRKRTS
jgi:MYXO-CTERM domain-containing protein